MEGVLCSQTCKTLTIDNPFLHVTVNTRIPFFVRKNCKT